MQLPDPKRESPAAWRARAVELAPRIAARVEKAAEQRRIPEETLDELERAGFSRALQPARWGGGERSPAELYEAQWLLAAACPSTRACEISGYWVAE